jgi:hypothetical protein
MQDRDKPVFTAACLYGSLRLIGSLLQQALSFLVAGGFEPLAAQPDSSPRPISPHTFSFNFRLLTFNPLITQHSVLGTIF